MEVYFERMWEDVEAPSYAHKGDSGADVRAYLMHLGVGPLLRILPGDVAMISTGLKVAIPHGYEIQVRSRSSLASRGVIIPNSPGTIDSGYRGEVKIMLMNLNESSIMIEHGERIAQLILSPVAKAHYVGLTSLSDTPRGEGGFGSTGRM